MNDARRPEPFATAVSRRQFLHRGLVLGSGLGAVFLLSACAPTVPAAPPAPTTAPVGQAAATAVPAAVTTTSAAATSATAPAQTQAPAAGQPKRGGAFVGAFEADPVSLDPHNNSNFSALQAYDHIYESLTAFDDKLKVVPSLAEKWEVSEDGMAYTFHLRQGVKFHNGQTMSAEDAKYSLDRVLDPNATMPWRSWLGPVKEVKVVDPQTIQVMYEAPFPGLLSGLAGNRGSGIMPVGYADKENTKLNGVGTGPFKLVEFVPQDHATYARNVDYWNKELPYLDGMTFKVLSEESTRLAALQAGQVQYANLSAQGVEQLKNSSTFTVLQAPYAWVGLTYINVSRPPADNPKVRKALRMAVDSSEVIQKSVFGAGTPSGPIPTGYGDWFLPVEELSYTRQDLEGARKLLAEAGFPQGNGAKIEILCSPQYPEFVRTATIMQEAFRKIGVETELRQEEWAAATKDYQANNYQMDNSANTFRPDPDGYVYPYFHSKGNLNAGGYNNPELDQLLDKARSISDAAQRKMLYQQIQKILLDDSPNFWWYSKFNFEVLSSKAQGYVQSFTGRQLFLKQTWLAG
ncbi:MAG: ABC transporter substrate-binding protein [Chloroflexota bacterium]|nr:ABC transporter substrate-binding protein [Chloroflexota bacterium]